MSMFLYYALHTFKNQIRKLFKTWVAVLILVCVVVGIGVGIGASVLNDRFNGSSEPDASDQVEEPEEPMTEADYAQLMQFLEIAIGGVTLLFLGFGCMNADKNGSRIFTMADVNLLFSAPLKPQSVLLFRLATQLGGILIASAYLLFQVPNLMVNLGLNGWTVLALLLTWALLLIYSQLLNLLIYTAASTRPRMKRLLRPMLLAAVLALTAGWLLYWKRTGLAPLDACLTFFNAPGTRLIPVWGWLKGLPMAVLEGNVTGAVLCFAALAVTAVLLTVGIWRMRADFYEDALARSSEMAEVMQAAQRGEKVIATRKKERSDRLTRDQFRHGWGANVYFYKALYNRFRFAHLGFLTKTAETYLLLSLVACAVLRFALQLSTITPVVGLLGIFVFFRSLGNPIREDTQQDSFLQVPESAWSKIFYSLAGGSVNCLLDLLPALVISFLILRASLPEALVGLVLILSIDFYSSAVGVFIDLSIPVSAAKTIKTLIQILFIYFGLAPVVILVIVGLVLNLLTLFAWLAAGCCLVIGMVFTAICPVFLTNGRK